MSGIISRTLVAIFLGAASLFVVLGYLILKTLGAMLTLLGISAFKTTSAVLDGQKAGEPGLFSQQVRYGFDLVKGYIWILPVGASLSFVAGLSQRNINWFWACFGVTILIWLFYAGMSVGLDEKGIPQHTKSRQRELDGLEIIRLREELNNRSGY